MAAQFLNWLVSFTFTVAPFFCTQYAIQGYWFILVAFIICLVHVATYLLCFQPKNFRVSMFPFFCSHMVYTKLVFTWHLNLRGNLGNVEENPARKISFSNEKKRLASCIYQVKRLWSRWNLYCIFIRNRFWNGGEYLKRFKYKSFTKSIIKSLVKAF